MIHELIFWGCFGMSVEIAYTAIEDSLIRKKNLNLMGHVSLWMFPIYAFGLSYGFDFINWLIQNNTIRYLTFPLWIWAVELLVGIPTANKGIKLWDYTYLPDWAHWRGIISYVHYPLWVGFGILVELIK